MLQACAPVTPGPVLEFHRSFSKRSERAFASGELNAKSLSTAEAFQRCGPELRILAALQPDLEAIDDRVRLWAIARGWRSHTFVVCKGERLEAAIFLRERLVLGLASGYFIGGDNMGDLCVLCDPLQRRRVLSWFFNWLLQQHAFVVHVQSSQPHSLSVRATDLSSGCTMRKLQVTSHWRHELGGTLDASIAAFGKRARRNIRHSLRAVLLQSWEFVPALTDSEVETSTVLIDERATYPASREFVQARAKLRSTLPGFFTAGLKHADGKWISTVSGVRSSDGVTRIFWQHNAVIPGHSVCTIMRALLIQAEVGRKTRRIEYIGGTNKLMENYCNEEVCTRTIFLKRGLRYRLFRSLMKTTLASPKNVLRTELQSGSLRRA